MVKKILFFAELYHYIRDYVKDDNLGNIYFNENAIPVDSISRHHLFQPDIGNNFKEEVPKDQERVQVYDMIWLFGKRCLVDTFTHAFSLRSGIEGVVSKKFFEAVPLRYNFLI